MAIKSQAIKPQPCRYMTQDTSPEKLGELLSSNPRGILVYRDELSGWFASLEREGNETARAFYLESWNGTGRFTVDRIGRGTVDIESATVSILGGIQPDRLGAYMSPSSGILARGDGLLQRLQVVAWPDPLREWESKDRWPNTLAREDAFKVYSRLSTIDPEQLGANASSRIPYLKFSEEAQEQWDEWRAGLERRVRSETEEPEFESMLSKYRSLVPSLALLIHLADCPQGGPVTREATARAIQWASYLEAHARRIYAPALLPELKAAATLSKRIQAGDLPARFSARDIYRKGWSGLKSPKVISEALTILEESGWVWCQELQTGGRPTSVFEMNPRLRPVKQP